MKKKTYTRQTYMSTPENVKDFDRMGHILKAQRPNYDKLKQSGGWSVVIKFETLVSQSCFSPFGALCDNLGFLAPLLSSPVRKKKRINFGVSVICETLGSFVKLRLEK